MNTSTHAIATTSGSIASRGASHRACAAARMFRAAAVAGVALLSLVCLPAAAVAQTTWSATPTSGLWNVGGNWAGGSAPTTGTTAANSIVFAASNLTTTTNNFSSGTFHSITFNSGAPSYTLSGSAVTLTEGSAISTILNNSSSDQTITNFAITGPVNTEFRSPNAWIILGTGGSVTGTGASNFQMGRNGPTRVKVDGGSISFASSIAMRGTATSTLWVTSGTATGTGAIQLGSNGNNATSVINLDGGVVQTGILQLGDNSLARTGALGTVNQTGGTLRANNVFKTLGTTGTLAFNLSGGTIAPFNNTMTFGSATSGSNADRITLTGNNGTISSIDRDGVARTVTIYTAIGDSGSNRGLTFSGSGGLIRLAATAANTYTGTTTVNSGTLQIGEGGTAGALNASSAVTGSSGATLAFARTDDYGGNFGNTISGGLGVRLNSGTLTLTAANTYTGTTTISAGRLNLSGGNDRLPTAAPLTITGGVLDLGGASQSTSGAISFQGGTVQGGTLTSTGGNFDGQNGTVSAALAGSVGLTKTTGNVLTLTGSNTFSGNIAVNDGSLNIGTNGVLGTSGTYAGSITLAAGDFTRFNYQSDANQALTGGIVSSGSNTNSIFYLTNGAPTGSGTVTFAAANPEFTSRLIVGNANATTAATLLVSHSNAMQMARLETRSNDKLLFAPGIGTFNVGSLFTGGASGTGNFALNDTSGNAITLSVGGNNRSETAFEGVMSGLGGLTKVGSGTLTLSGSNSYSGTTTVTAGQLALSGGDNRLATNAPITITGGVLDLGNRGQSTSGPISFQGGTVQSGTLTSTGGAFDGQAGTVTAVLAGGVGLTKTTSGTLVLTASNSYSSTTTVNAGTLQIGASGTTGALSASSTITGSSGATLAFARTDAYGGNFGNAISGGLGVVLRSGTLAVTGSNAYTGTTQIDAGTLQIGSSGTTGALGASTAISGSAGGTLAFARTDNYGGNFGNTLSGGLGLRLSSGTLALTGNNASYTGTTQVNGGVLTLSSANAIGSTGTVSFGGGTLQYTASNSADLSARIAGSGSAIAINTNSQSGTWASSLASSNSGGLSKSGAGTLTLSASNAFSGPVSVLGTSFVDNVLAVTHPSALGNGTTVTVQGGALDIGSGITTGAGKTVTVQSVGGSSSDGGLRVRSGTGTWAGTVTMGGGRLGYTNANLVISGSVGGGGALIISGYGDGLTNTGSAFGVTLAGPAGYTGGTQIIRGWLKIGADNTLPVGTTLDVFTIPNNTGAANAATFDLNGFNQTVAGLTSTGNNSKTGFANGYVTNTGPAVRTLTVNQATTGTYGGLITGNLAFTKSGAGNLTLMPILVTTTGTNLFTSGTNTFTGDTRVDAGTLTLSTATGNTSLALFGSTFDSSGAGTLSFGSMTAATFGGLKGPGNLALENASAAAVALTVGANNGSTSFAGVLSGLGSLVKSGTGTLTLTNANTYAGTTAVAAGSLLVNGSLAGVGAVTVDSGATLGGSGSIAGAVTVNGFLSPGTSPGVLSVASLVLGASSTSLFEIDGTTRGGQYDGVDITGLSGPTYGGTLSLVFGNTFADDTTFDLFSFSGSPTGDFSTVTSSGAYAGTWSQVTSGTWRLESGSKTLTFSQSTGDIIVVPEPAALALAAIGIAAAAWARRRTRKKPGAEATG